MTLRVLVAGLLEHDSGKTWLSYALARLAGSTAAVYKPIGGFNAWYSMRVLRESERLGLLLGNDALLYHRLSGADPAVLNPVAYATVPPDPLTAVRAPARYLASLASLEAGLAVWRLPLQGCGSAVHAYSPEALDSAPPGLARLLRRLVARLSAARASAREFLEVLGRGLLDEALEECRERLEAGKKLLVVESYNNAAVPYRGLDLCSMDFYLVAAPGRALLYPAERACRALEVTGLERVDRLLPYLGAPLASLELPPAESPEELADALEASELAGLLGEALGAPG